MYPPVWFGAKLHMRAARTQPERSMALVRWEIVGGGILRPWSRLWNGSTPPPASATGWCRSAGNHSSMIRQRHLLLRRRAGHPRPARPSSPRSCNGGGAARPSLREFPALGQRRAAISLSQAGLTGRIGLASTTFVDQLLLPPDHGALPLHDAPLAVVDRASAMGANGTGRRMRS